MAPRITKQGRRATSIGCNYRALLAIKPRKSCKVLLIESLNQGEILSEHVCTYLDLMLYFMGKSSTDSLILIRVKYCTITFAIENKRKCGIYKNLAGLGFLSGSP